MERYYPFIRHLRIILKYKCDTIFSSFFFFTFKLKGRNRRTMKGIYKGLLRPVKGFSCIRTQKDKSLR